MPAGILSTLGEYHDYYGYMYGTSMSTPHVSGVAALALSYAKQLGKTFEPDEFRDMLLSSVNDIATCTESRATPPQGMVYNGKLDMDERRGKMGTGMIDAYKMLMAVRGTPAVTVEPERKPLFRWQNIMGDVAFVLYASCGRRCGEGSRTDFTTGEDGTVKNHFAPNKVLVGVYVGNIERRVST